MSQQLEEFGRELIQEVHDMAYVHWAKVMKGEMRDAESQELAKWLGSQPEDVTEKFADLPPRVIQNVLHYLLAWLESNDHISISSDGIDIAAESDGLAGELYGSNGWLKRYSDPDAALEN